MLQPDDITPEERAATIEAGEQALAAIHALSLINLIDSDQA